MIDNIFFRRKEWQLKHYNVNQGNSDFATSNCFDLQNIIWIMIKVEIIVRNIGIPGKLRHK
ncbi:MAG: hypothetical protein DRI57_02835 [Deltaproteobacteria bacterium]|nr:MAG: hypothetical protein DRI57_02835 [Deltaproteobacteria bacterium]